MALFYGERERRENRERLSSVVSLLDKIRHYCWAFRSMEQTGRLNSVSSGRRAREEMRNIFGYAKEDAEEIIRTLELIRESLKEPGEGREEAVLGRPSPPFYPPEDEDEDDDDEDDEDEDAEDGDDDLRKNGAVGYVPYRGSRKSVFPSDGEGFMHIPEDVDEELPLQ